MLRKLLACLMAAVLSLSAVTLVAYAGADRVSIVNPAGMIPSSGQLGLVCESELVDIPKELLESLADESSEESSSETSSSSASSVPPSSALVSSTFSTVTIPSNLSSSSSSSSSSKESSRDSSSISSAASSSVSSTVPEPEKPAEETLIVKISGESEVGVYPVSEILPKIVAMEMDDRMADEALKAQAVATHSYIKYQNNSGKAPVVPVRTPSARIKSLVLSVASEMMYYGGGPANAAYTASTAGRTESSVNVWGGSVPYLVSVESAYDYLDPNWGTRNVYTTDQVRSMVEKNAGITLEGDPSTWFEILSYTSGGYNDAMAIGGQTTFQNGGKTYKITGQYMREVIMRQSGLPTLKSTKFDVTVEGDQIVFTTYGYGHCVGMSQWGAHYYATQGGYTYQQILKHYYTGVTIR